MRAVWPASLQHWTYIDTNAWCKRVLKASAIQTTLLQSETTITDVILRISWKKYHYAFRDKEIQFKVQLNFKIPSMVNKASSVFFSETCSSQQYEDLTNLRFNMFDCEMMNSFINMTAVRMSTRVEASLFEGPVNETDKTNNRIGGYFKYLLTRAYKVIVLKLCLRSQGSVHR